MAGASWRALIGFQEHVKENRLMWPLPQWEIGL
jgi:hypothetical protein